MSANKIFAVTDTVAMLFVTLAIFGMIISACCIYTAIPKLSEAEQLCLTHEGVDVYATTRQNDLVVLVCNDGKRKTFK